MIDNQIAHANCPVIYCPQCGRVTPWSGVGDPRCNLCLSTPTMPRAAVLGDICDWADSGSEAFEREKLKYSMLLNDFKFASGGQWGPIQINLPYQYSSKVLNKAQEQKQRIENLSNDVDQLQRVIKLYHKQRARQRERIQQLEAQGKADQDFIELQARRLINARNHLARIRFHCDLPEVGDSGKRLDP